MSTGKVVLGVLAGVAIGATLGILFAPDKGSETRKKLSKKGEDYAKELEEKFNDLISSFKERFEEASKELADEAKEEGQEAKEEITGQMRRGV